MPFNTPTSTTQKDPNLSTTSTTVALGLLPDNDEVPTVTPAANEPPLFISEDEAVDLRMHDGKADVKGVFISSTSATGSSTPAPVTEATSPSSSSGDEEDGIESSGDDGEAGHLSGDRSAQIENAEEVSGDALASAPSQANDVPVQNTEPSSSPMANADSSKADYKGNTIQDSVDRNDNSKTTYTSERTTVTQRQNLPTSTENTPVGKQDEPTTKTPATKYLPGVSVVVSDNPKPKKGFLKPFEEVKADQLIYEEKPAQSSHRKVNREVKDDEYPGIEHDVDKSPVIDPANKKHRHTKARGSIVIKQKLQHLYGQRFSKGMLDIDLYIIYIYIYSRRALLTRELAEIYIACRVQKV